MTQPHRSSSRLPFAHRTALFALSLMTCACIAPTPKPPSEPEVAQDEPEVPQDESEVVPEEPMLDLAAIVTPLAEERVDGTGGDTSKAVGMVVAVAAGDQEAVFGFGASHIGGDPPDGDTFFGLASLTKVFAGLALASVVDQGEVGLETSAQALLGPDLVLPDPSISLGDLIAHQSGLSQYPSNMVDRNGDGVHDLMDANPGNDFPPWSPGWHYTRQDLRAELETYQRGEQQLVQSPGDGYIYSNTGIGLVGIALADHLGLPDTDTVLRDLLLTPLGMKDTGTRVEPFLSRAEAGGAQGYKDLDGDGVLDEVSFSDMGVLAAGGEVISTGNDMLRFLRAWVGVQTPLSGAVERAVLPVAPADEETDMGYALAIRNEDGVTVYDKGGTSAGFLAHIRFSREPALGVVVLSSNGTGTEHNSREVAHAVYEALAEATGP